MTVGKRAREFRAVEARRAEEAAAIVAALQQAEGVDTVEGLALGLWHQSEDLRQELAAAVSRDAALRAALLAEQGRTARAERRALEADARVAVAQAERDAARAGEDAVTRRLLLAESRLRTAEARLARLGTAPPPMPVARAGAAPATVEAEAALFWLRQQRGLAAEVRYLHLSRLDRPDGREVRRLVGEAMAAAEGADRAAVVERLRVALRALRAEVE